jgi:hypothetical protein
MSTVIYQGKVALDGSTKIFNASGITINTIIINNLDSNYVFTLNRFEEGVGIHNVPIYKFELDAGDTIRDETEYKLSSSDYLQLISDVIGTTYYIYTEES